MQNSRQQEESQKGQLPLGQNFMAEKKSFKVQLNRGISVSPSPPKKGDLEDKDSFFVKNCIPEEGVHFEKASFV